MGSTDFWLDLLAKHWGKILGGFLGLVVGVIFLKYGFLRTVFLLLMVAGGIYAGGRRIDGSVVWRNFFKSMWK